MRWKYRRIAAILVALAALMLAATGCVKIDEERGVDNKWRDNPAGFVNGKTTKAEVLRLLGPPSQVIALKDEVVFYYVREQLKGRQTILILYNTVEEKTIYDRAIFFFNRRGILTQHSISAEKIPKKAK